MKTFATALALLAGFATVPALAMEPYLPKSPKTFGKVDTDGNGKVTAAELQPFAEKRFARIDADRNGAVTVAEIDTALTRALERRKDRMLAKLDADRNGSISREELDRYVDRMVAEADGNQDGGLSLEEARNDTVAKLRKPATGETSN
jgi:Ca2+-binding EF-hand superfamily protein